MHGNNSYQALNRILSFYPAEGAYPPCSATWLRPSKPSSRKRLVRTVEGARVPAVEVMLATAWWLIWWKGSFLAVKDADGKVHGRRFANLEEASARLIMEKKIDRKECMPAPISLTNLDVRLQNDFAQAANAAKAQKKSHDTPDDQPSFTEIVLDVRQLSLLGPARLKPVIANDPYPAPC